MNKQDLKIDPELQSLLPPLSEGEYKNLEENIVNNGYDKNFPIIVWKGYIADGHNRYKICKDHNIIDYTVTTLAYQTKEEVMEWMLDVQLGRRNLNKAQRVLAAERFREYYERQARENMSLGGGDQKSGSPKWVNPIHKVDVQKTLAQKAGVGNGTYSRCKTVLDSDNKDLKQQMLSGEITINAAYNIVKESQRKETEIKHENIIKPNITDNHLKESNNTTASPVQSTEKEVVNNAGSQEDMLVEDVVAEQEDVVDDHNEDVIDGIFNPTFPVLDDKVIEEAQAIYEKESMSKQRNKEDMKQVTQVCKELKRDNTVDVFHKRLDEYAQDISFILSSIQNDTEHTLEDLNSCVAYVEDFYNNIKDIIEQYK